MSEILLRIVEGANVALYRHEEDRVAEIVPTRVDLYKYPGGFGWGYGGSGAVNLSHAIAGKIFEYDHLEVGELRERAMVILERVIASLDDGTEHDVPVEMFTKLFSNR
jgi:hypothetical protein